MAKSGGELARHGPSMGALARERQAGRKSRPMPRLIALDLPVPPPDAAAPAAARGQPQPALRFALRAGPSRIDGLGVFAEETIPARRKIGEMRGESISVREARRRAKGRARVHIVEVSETRAVDATDSPEPLRNINHSCGPNAVLRIRQGRVEFYALRDIAPGEEITCHYGDSHHEGRLTCRCGAPNCSGRL